MTRTTVKALHRGKVVTWPVEEITHFTHADKYTVAWHADGRELLLTDTIKDLAEEFACRFIRVNRGILVARDRLTGVQHDPERIEGIAHVQGVSTPIKCSRSCMPEVTRYLRKRDAQ